MVDIGTFELIYERFRTNRSNYYILLKETDDTMSTASKIFKGYDSCKSNLIYLVSGDVFNSLDTSSLPKSAKFLPISFAQFLTIVEDSPNENSLKIIENDCLEIDIQIGDVKHYIHSKSTKLKERKLDFIFFCLYGLFLICVLALKALYVYVSYVLIFNLLNLTGFFAFLLTMITFILLNLTSDKLLNNLIRDLE